VVEDAVWLDVAQDLPAVLRALGDVIDDYYEFQPSAAAPQVFRAWAEYRGGIELDLLVLPTSGFLGSGPDGRTLFDPDALILKTDHPMRLSEPAAIAKWSFVCWGALGAVAKNLARDHAAAAIEWLNPAREATISCWAAAHGVEYAAYANVAATRLGVSCPWPDGLEKTYPEPTRRSVVAAALELARLQERVEELLAQRLGIPPRPIASAVISQLELVQARLPAPDSQRGRRSRADKPRGAARRSRRPPGAPRAR
jgi:hypothetical protein